MLASVETKTASCRGPMRELRDAVRIEMHLRSDCLVLQEIGALVFDAPATVLARAPGRGDGPTSQLASFA
jgi:hypothetical protein